MVGDNSSSRDLFTAGLKQSEAMGMKDGVFEARTALRRLDKLDFAANKNSSPITVIKDGDRENGS